MCKRTSLLSHACATLYATLCAVCQDVVMFSSTHSACVRLTIVEGARKRRVELSTDARQEANTQRLTRLLPRATLTLYPRRADQPATAATVTVTAVEQSEHFTSDLRDGGCATRCR